MHFICLGIFIIQINIIYTITMKLFGLHKRFGIAKRNLVTDEQIEIAYIIMV